MGTGSCPCSLVYPLGLIFLPNSACCVKSPVSISEGLPTAQSLNISQSEVRGQLAHLLIFNVESYLVLYLHVFQHSFKTVIKLTAQF